VLLFLWNVIFRRPNSPSSDCNFSKEGNNATNKSNKIEALIKGIIPNENGIKLLTPLPASTYS
jgi:hypothetical protein